MPPRLLYHGPTRDSYTDCSANQADVTSEEDYDDGHRNFVYAPLSSRCANRLLGDKAEEDDHLVSKTVIVRYYNEYVHSFQEDMSYDASDGAFVSGLPAHYYAAEEIYGEYGFVDETTAFERGYAVYDFIAAWSHLKETERRYHPTFDDDPRGGKPYEKKQKRDAADTTK